LIADFLSNISAKYHANPTMLSRVIAKYIGDVFDTSWTDGLWQLIADEGIISEKYRYQSNHAASR